MRKHGSESCACVKDWVINHEFPETGTLSTNQLKKLEERLRRKEEEMSKQKKVKGKDIREMQRHFKCLKMWQNEAESRDKWQEQGKIEKEEERSEPHARDMQSLAHPHIPPPPPYNPLYLSLTSRDDPTLLECPLAPRTPPPPESQEEGGASEGASGGPPEEMPDSRNKRIKGGQKHTLIPTIRTRLSDVKKEKKSL